MIVWLSSCKPLIYQNGLMSSKLRHRRSQGSERVSTWFVNAVRGKIHTKKKVTENDGVMLSHLLYIIIMLFKSRWFSNLIVLLLFDLIPSHCKETFLPLCSNFNRIGGISSVGFNSHPFTHQLTQQWL